MSTTKRFIDAKGMATCFCKDHTYLSPVANDVVSELSAFMPVGEVFSDEAKASQLAAAFMQWYNGEAITMPEFLEFASSGREILPNYQTSTDIENVWRSSTQSQAPVSSDEPCIVHTIFAAQDLEAWLATKF